MLHCSLCLIAGTGPDVRELRAFGRRGAHCSAKLRRCSPATSKQDVILWTGKLLIYSPDTADSLPMVAPRTYLPSNPVVGSLVDYPTTAFVLALGIPWLIVYLHIIDEPGTRWVRRAIWPLGVMMTWIGGGIDDDVGESRP